MVLCALRRPIFLAPSVNREIGKEEVFSICQLRYVIADKLFNVHWALIV
jgi:hypothetical protein